MLADDLHLRGTRLTTQGARSWLANPALALGTMLGREACVREFHRRSLAKTVCWRLVATSSTVGIVYLFTGKGTLSLGIGGAEAALKMLLYYFHERAWDWIRWGKPRHPLAGLAVSRELEPAHLEEIRERLRELGYL